MDHFKSLDRFRIGTAPLQRCPWLRFDHDSQLPCCFSDYPLLRGWTSQQIVSLRSGAYNEDNSMDRIASLAMLQSWLFVGALEAIAGTRIPTTDFVLETKRGPLVTTAFLQAFLDSFVDSARQLHPEDKRNLYQKTSEILSEVQFWCLRISSFSLSLEVSLLSAIPSGNFPWSSSSWSDYEFNLDCTSRLITLVGESINTSKSHLVAGGTISDVYSKGFKGSYTFNGQSRLIGRLVRCGWCPFMARILFTYRYSVAEFASFWPRKGIQYKLNVHQDCSPVRCVGYNIDTATYRNQHRPASCRCKHIVPPLEDIKRILRSGGIPVIRLAAAKSSSPLPQEEISSACKQDDVALVAENAAALTAGNGYLAISHVWSDGMGSDAETGLPRCLLRKLFSNASSCGRNYIWIDSLCVPADKELRGKAIRLMAATYQGADVTLVLDSTIANLPFSLDTNDIELVLLRLTASGWMQRLWTLQEALLSKWLVFEFSNTIASAFDVYAAVSLSIQEHLNPITQVLGRELLRLLKRDSRVPIYDKDLQLGDVQRMLRIRSTTKIGDETLALAGLFGVDAYTLVQIPTEQRMKKFFQLLKWLPADILFLNKPHMLERGWRWAVVSFLPDVGKGTAARDPMSLTTGQRAQKAECLEQGGLCGVYLVVRLSETVELDADRCVLIQLPDRLLRVGTSENELKAPFSFDTVIMMQSLGNLKEIKIGAALLSTVKRYQQTTLMYEYQRRFLVRTIEGDGYLNELQEKVINGSEEETKIVIL